MSATNLKPSLEQEYEVPLCYCLHKITGPDRTGERRRGLVDEDLSPVQLLHEGEQGPLLTVPTKA